MSGCPLREDREPGHLATVGPLSVVTAGTAVGRFCFDLSTVMDGRGRVAAAGVLGGSFFLNFFFYFFIRYFI